MPETTQRDIPYPLGGEIPAFPDDFRNLADGVDALVPKTAMGKVRIAPSGDMTTVNVDFPAGLFNSSDPIHMFATGHSSVPGNSFKSARAGNATQSGGIVRLHRTNNTTTLIDWLAIQENGGGVKQVGYELPQYEGSTNTRAIPTRYFNSLQAAVRQGLVRVDAGDVLFDNITPNEPTMRYATFKEGLFSEPPIVLTAMMSEQAGNTALGSAYLADGVDGAEIYYQRSSRTNTWVHWIALQATNRARLWTPGGPADLAGKQQEFAEKSEDTIPRVDMGRVDIDPTPGTPSQTHAEFTPGLFDRPPYVAVCTWSNTGAVSNWGFKNVTTSGVDIVLTRSNSTTTGLAWLAVQP